MRALLHRVIWRERSPHPGDILLGLAAAAAWIAAVFLALAPDHMVNGPSLRVIYSVPELVGLPGRRSWAVLWVLIAAAPTTAVLRPTAALRQRAYEVLLGAGVAWTAGLGVPLAESIAHDLLRLPGPPPTANFWGPLVFAFVTLAGFVIWLLVPLTSPFYRPVRGRPPAEGQSLVESPAPGSR